MDGCSDIPSGPNFAEASADVSCTSFLDGSWDFFIQGLNTGDALTLMGNDIGPLPEEVTCFIYVASDSNPVQSFTIDLSGEQELFLLDTFGSLQLEACDELDCMVEVTYAYTVINTGSVDATIEKFERERDGVVLDLLNSVELTVVSPGNTASSSETEFVNYCLDAVYYTVVTVEAVPETGGLICPATAEYEFEVNVGCRVDVDITCVNADGTACTDIVSPDGSCTSGGPVETLTFTYNPASCEEGFPTHSQPNPFCQDLESIPDGPVTLVCSADPEGDTLVVAPSIVSPGDSITITRPDGGPLPAQVYCSINDGANGGATVFQEFSFFTTNGDDGAELDAKDQFGSLSLVSCSDGDGIILDCLQILQYTYTITNVGPNDMDLSQLERTRNNLTASLLDSLSVTNLKPGDVTQVRESEIVDVCEENDFSTFVSVEANPENGLVCFDEDEYFFEINPPCSLEVSFLPFYCLFNMTLLSLTFQSNTAQYP